MSVAYDANSTTCKNVTGVATLTISDMTVGTGANRALVALVWVSSNVDQTGAVTATWDSGASNQAMTVISGTEDYYSGNSQYAVMFGLVNPVSGNKSLVVSWSGNREAHAEAISFTGVNQTSVATAFAGTKNNQTSATSGPASVSVTSAAGHMAVGGCMQQANVWGGTYAGTVAVSDATGPAMAVVGLYDSGAASVTLSASFSGTDSWMAMGADVVSAGAPAVTFTLGDYTLDYGLAGMDSVCDKIYVCAAAPTSYADATSGANSLGSKNWGAGNAFGSPAAGTNGRQISSTPITDGSVTANGTVAAWAAVDSSNSRLLASGPLTGGIAVTSGQVFTLGALTLNIARS